MNGFKLLLTCLMTVCLSACGSSVDSAEVPPSKMPSAVEYSYIKSFDSMEDIIRSSSNIVEATLVSVEDFDGAVSVYLFDVTTDYTENTPEQIHMYDAYNDEYIAGHTYYLYLWGDDNALYPHTVYTTVIKDLIIDTASPQINAQVAGNEIKLRTSNVKGIISAAVEDNIVGENLSFQPLQLSEGSDLRDISSQADVIAAVKVTNESQANPYVSSYSVNLVSMLKGQSDQVATHMALPPGLNSESTYYVFLKEDPNFPGTYLLFSPDVPVTAVTEETTALLALE